MVLRKCTVCDRRFTKTEHFKRHERSHTKERPYECKICHKRYARSDVLSRHVKGHNSKPDDGASIPTGRPPASQQTPIQNPPAILDAPPAVTAQDDTQGLLPGMGVQMHPVQDLSSASHAMAPPPPPDIPPPSVAYMADIYTNFDRSEPDTNSMLADGQQTYSGWNTQSPSGPSSDRGPALGSIPNEMLQLWLESWGDTYSPNDSLELARSPNFGVGAGDLVPSLNQQHRPSTDSSKSDNIPNERFAKVQRYWLAPSNSGGRLINSLWGVIATSDLDNIFAVRAPNLLGSRADLLQGSRYGLDEECKQHLQAAFCPAQAANHQRHPQSAAGPANSLPNFPPAEILDMALDIYFRDFHPLVPFVHLPTFSAKNTRPLLLYVMCLIGMAMLGTKGTMNFVLKNFEPVLEMVTAGLSKCSLGCEPFSTLSTFATTVLFLNLSSMTGDKEHFEKCQMLYVNLISIAQRHGLFTPAEGQLLDASLFEASDIDKRWKVWSMIESTKRLVAGLLLLDSSYSSFLSTSPIIASDSVQLILPCNEDLFRARSSTQWLQLIQSGKRILMPTIMAPSENIKIPLLESPADDVCVPGVLAMIQIRLSEAYHRLLSNRASYPFAPCHTYAMDGRARCLPSLQLQIANEYGEALTRLSPNAPIMWHSMCMKLTADIQIFDLAAERAGPVPARKALDDIAAWSQTPAARRGCLHAAHIYKSMATRKTSDHPICHSVFSLFSAALVLGLYIFMVPNSPETQTPLPGIELLDDVDWKQLGTEGFTSFMEPQGIHSQSLGPTDNPATNFVRNGGTVYFRGLPFQGGYLAARRILLDYAGLLKDAGPWSVRKFSYILHIMSDVLMDME